MADDLPRGTLGDPIPNAVQPTPGQGLVLGLDGKLPAAVLPALTPAAGSITSAMIADGAILDIDVNAAAAIALTKLATIPVIGQSNVAWRIQQVTSPGPSTSSRAVTYPVAFSAVPFIVGATNGSDGGVGAAITSITASGFTFTNGGASGADFHWIAFGLA